MLSKGHGTSGGKALPANQPTVICYSHGIKQGPEQKEDKPSELTLMPSMQQAAADRRHEVGKGTWGGIGGQKGWQGD